MAVGLAGSAEVKEALWHQVVSSPASLVVEPFPPLETARLQAFLEVVSVESARDLDDPGWKAQNPLQVSYTYRRNYDADNLVPTEGGRPWRASRTASGNFEGVLGGFGGSHTATPTQPPVNEADESLAPPIEAPHTAPVTGGWRERMAAKQGVEKEIDETPQPAPAVNGGPGWINTTSSKWRTTLTGNDVLQSPLDVPRSNAPTTASVIATPSATPVPDRDATIRATPGPEEDHTPARQDAPAEDLGKIDWFYRDPHGEEHGESRTSAP
jgi:hypothetical protein